MSSISTPSTIPKTVHTWLRRIHAAYVPGRTTPLLEVFAGELIKALQRNGQVILPEPQEGTDVLLTTAPYGEPISWREGFMFTARRRFNLQQAPLVFTLIHATPEGLRATLDRFAAALAKNPPDPGDFAFPGLAPQAYGTLYEQGQRGGPILSLVRLLQSQAKSIRIILVVGEGLHPIEAYTFDLVGAHPRSDASQGQAFYDDLALRIVTAASTHEITDHQMLGDPIPYALWQSLRTPAAMRRAGRELGKRHFFTEMVRVADLVSVPAIHEAVANQYSEGCFGTWDPALDALVVTVTGSARPVVKDKLTDNELAVITGVRPDGLGAEVRHVEGKRNDPPSSEAVEMMEMDYRLPFIALGSEWGVSNKVPTARSKLHGHRGVSAYDPTWVEHVPLDPAYYHYPVSCSTNAQAQAIKAAFARSQSLKDLSDPRQVIFTVLPGHGVVLVEKWVQVKEPFQVIWEFMDSGRLVIEKTIPQGPLAFIADQQGKMVLTEPL
jgi:hypothetical protein